MPFLEVFFSRIFMIFGYQILMILNDFGCPGAHFLMIFEYFGRPGGHVEGSSDFYDFYDVSGTKK